MEDLTEEYDLVVPFDPSILHRSVLQYRRAFLEEIQLWGSVPDEFEAIKAKLYYYVNQRSVDNKNTNELRELCTLLPDLSQDSHDQLPIVPAYDLVDDREKIDGKSPLDRDSPHLHSLNTQITRLYRIAQELFDDTIFHPLLKRLIAHYEAYRDSLCSNDVDILELLTPKPTICGIDVPHSQLSSQGVGLKIQSRTEKGEGVRENDRGYHNVTRVGDIMCKAKKLGRNFQYGYANAAAYAYQMLNRRYRVATPATLLIVGQVFCKKPEKHDESLEELLYYSRDIPYMRNVIQATSVSEGDLLEEQLQLEYAFKQWKKSYEEADLLELLRNPTDPDNLEKLTSTSNLEREVKKELPSYLKMMTTLIKDYTPEKALAEMPNFRDQLDWYTICAKVFADIWINAIDMKGENMMGCAITDPQSDEPLRYIESFDNEDAFMLHIVLVGNSHCFTLKSLPTFFNLRRPIHPKIVEEWTEFPAIYMMLSWLELIYEDEKRFRERVEQRVFTEKVMLEDGKPSLGMPIMFHPTVPYRMLRMLIKLQTIVRNATTMKELIDQLLPMLGKYIEILTARYPDNPLQAYMEHQSGITIESVFVSAGVEIPDLKPYSLTEEDAEKKTMGTEAAIADIVLRYHYKASMQEQYRLLEYVARFRFIKKLKYSTTQLNEFLMNIAETMLPNALELLLRCGADVNTKNAQGETALHRVFSRKDLDKIVSRRSVISLLLTHKNVDLTAACSQNLTPLMAFVRNAKGYSFEFIDFVINLFVEKGADLNQIIDNRTAMDMAIANESSDLLYVLAHQGGRFFCDIDRAIEFLLRFKDDDRIIKTTKILLRLNPKLNFKRSLSLATKTKSDSEHVAFIEGDYKAKYFFHNDVSKQIFSKDGQFFQANTVAVGQFNVVKVMHHGELLFYAASDPQFPDTELAASRIHQLIKSYGASHGEIFKCTDHNGQTFKLLLIGACEAEPLSFILQDEERRRSVFANLDLSNLSKLVIINVLLGLSGTADNIFVTPCQLRNGTRYILTSLLHAGAFSPSQQEAEAEPGKLFAHFQSFGSMRLDIRAIAELLPLDPYEVLKAWKEDLFLEECRVNSITSQSRTRGSTPRGSAAQIAWPLFRSGDIKQFCYRLEALLEILRKIKSPEFTVGDFLRCAEPLFLGAKRVETLVQTSEPVRASPRRTPRGILSAMSPRLKLGFKSPRKAEAVAPAINAPAQILETAQAPWCTVTEVGIELDTMRDDQQLLAKATKEMQVGEFKSFYALSAPQLKQKAVNTILPKVSGVKGLAERVLAEAAGVPLVEFEAKDCAFFSDRNFSPILMASYCLRVLNVAGSQELSNNLTGLLSTYCPSIADLNVDRTLIVELPLALLPNLVVVSAANCNKMIRVQFDAPNLMELNFESSKNMQVLELCSRTPNLRKVNVNHCESLDPVFLRRLPLLSSSLNDFRHLHVQEFNVRAYFRNIELDRKISRAQAFSLVHNESLKLFGVTVPEELLNRILIELINENVPIHANEMIVPHKTQRLKMIDLRGCSYSLRAIASMIEKIKSLERIKFQPSAKPTMEKPVQIKALSIKSIELKAVQKKVTGDEKLIKKMLPLPDGHFIFFYDDGSYKLWNIDDLEELKLLRVGHVGRKLTDADLLPSGDLIVCCDGVVKVLDAVNWELTECVALTSNSASNYRLVKVIGKNRIVLGGDQMSVFEITRQGFVPIKSFPGYAITAMVITPNQNTFVAQTENQGTLIWRIDNAMPVEDIVLDLVGEKTSSISSLIVMDDFNVMMVDSYSGNEIILNLQTKAVVLKKVCLGVNIGIIAPGGELILGGPQSNDLVVYNPQTKKHLFPYKAILATIVAKTKAKIEGLCFTAHGDLLINMGKSAWLIRNEALDLSLTFASSLPTSLVITHHRTPEHASAIKIEHKQGITSIEKSAIGALNSFIDAFFSVEKFTIERDQTVTVIGSIPLEDACIYQMMFESFVQRATEFQQSFAVAQRKQPSPRKPGAPAPTFFSSQTQRIPAETTDTSVQTRRPTLTRRSDEDDNGY